MLGELAGCGEQAAVNELPEPLYSDHLVGEAGGGAVRIDPSKIVVPPPVPPEKSQYGDIMPRAAWTRSPLALRDGIPIDGINKLTIHHSGDGKPFLGESVADVARHLQVVQQAHLQRGMIDIAYHFAVDRVGRVWQLRWLTYEGQHVRTGKNGVRNNEHNLGVVVLGDFNVQGVTVPQRDRLFEFVRRLRGYYPSIKAVYMHGELVETDCPGARLRPLILDARRLHMF